MTSVRCFGASFLLLVGVASAQSTQVFPLGTTTVNATENGLGFNINPQQSWQLGALSSAGARWWRMQCNWSEVEQQTAPPSNKAAVVQYKQSTACAKTYQAASSYPGLSANIVAGFGPPYHPILEVRLTSPAAIGDTALSVVLVTGVGSETLSNVVPVLDHINDLTTLHTAPYYGAISNKHSSAGDIITSVVLTDSTHATLHLGSAVKNAIPVSDTLEIMEDLYKGIDDNSPSNPSAVAYGNYATFLAQDMATRGFSGYVELWNEPPWASDPWDAIQVEYDYAVSGNYKPETTYGVNAVVFESAENQKPYISIESNNKGNNPASSPAAWSPTIPYNAYVRPVSPFPTWGLIANVMTRTWPSRVHATASSGSGSGANTPLSPAFQKLTGVALNEPDLTVTNESFHPYCGPHCNPEEALTSPACIQAASTATSAPANNPYAGKTCYVPGTAHKGNLLSYFLENDQEKNSNPSYGLGGDVTETNNFDTGSPGDFLQVGKGDVRHFLGLEANGIDPVIFYELCSGPGTSGAASLGSFTGTSNGTNTLILSEAAGYSLAYVGSNNTIISTNKTTGISSVFEGGNLEIVTGNQVPANTVITAVHYASGIYRVTLNQAVPSGTSTFAIRSWDPTIGFVTTPSGSCFFSSFISTTTYPLNAEVTESLSDSTPYVSLQPNNIGHDPARSPAWWSPKGIYTPTPMLTALAGVLSDLKPISNLPVVRYASSDLPYVSSYSGTYPLGTVYMVGARNSVKANSVAMYIYQLSECTTGVHCWTSLAAPAGATATINLVAGSRITSAIDVITRKVVAYSVSGTHVMFSGNVSDDPIEIIIDPDLGSRGALK